MSSPWQTRVVLAGPVLGALLGWACAAGTFMCQDDAACRSDAGAGVCQSDGFCSFPDDACPSGQRYGEHAGDGKQHDCVAVGDDPSSDGASGSGSATTSADDATATTTGASSPVSASNATGGSTDDGDADTGATTGTLTSDPGSTGSTGAPGSSSGGTTEGPPLDCSIDDEFDAPALDMAVWGSWGSEEGVTVVQTGGVVRFTVGTGATGIGGLITVPPISVAQSMVTFTVGEPPDPATTVEQSFILQGSGSSVRVVLNDGMVQVVVWDGTDNTVPYGEAHDIQPGDRFRFTFTDSDVTVAMSLGQASFTELYSGSPPFEPGEVEVVARALSYDQLVQPSSVEVDAISVCAL